MNYESAIKRAEELRDLSIEDKEFYDYVLWIIKEAHGFMTKPSGNKKIRLEGKQFGDLKVIEEVAPITTSNGTVSRAWLCKCKCGNTKVIAQSILKTGRDCSCGCKTNAYEIVGKKFGKFLIIERLDNQRDKYGHMRSLYLCKKNNGETVIKDRHSLTALEIVKEKKKRDREERKIKKLKQTYASMKDRCFDNTSKGYKWYGERGIIICDEWIGENGFSNFCDWSLNNGFDLDLSIDRIDVNGNYSPENCRWVDMKTQQRNKRNTHYVTYNGETKSVGEWSEITGINYNTLLRRINNGWDIEKAMTKPGRKK